ncbi:hypothetical protein K469DRAFT_27978 [Zopfia rhizophila CBS 207.26]|uniref:Uncharacterized protein n=1 Tax=Zopfia rhizophila CBS 207.26 TaxID=1314779 RepID=A0A6A6EGY3_9PEZI|nr:hypothetical protein K469DRAFT_27978 [Zopfia rhizophila CBS 207.26]
MAKVIQIFSKGTPPHEVLAYTIATYTWTEFKTKARVPQDIFNMCERRSKELQCPSKGWYYLLLECLPFLQLQPQKKIIYRWGNPQLVE